MIDCEATKSSHTQNQNHDHLVFEYVHESPVFKQTMMKEYTGQYAILSFNEMVLQSFLGLKVMFSSCKNEETNQFATMVSSSIVNSRIEIGFLYDNQYFQTIEKMFEYVDRVTDHKINGGGYYDLLFYQCHNTKVIKPNYSPLSSWIGEEERNGKKQIQFEKVPLLKRNERMMNFVDSNSQKHEENDFEICDGSLNKHNGNPKLLKEMKQIISIWSTMTLHQDKATEVDPNQKLAFAQDVPLQYITCIYDKNHVIHKETMMYELIAAMKEKRCAACPFVTKNYQCSFKFPTKWIVNLMRCRIGDDDASVVNENISSEEAETLKFLKKQCPKTLISSATNRQNIMYHYIANTYKNLFPPNSSIYSILLDCEAQYTIDSSTYFNVKRELNELRNKRMNMQLENLIADCNYVERVEYFVKSMFEALEYVPCGCCGVLNHLCDVRIQSAPNFEKKRKASKMKHHFLTCYFCGFRFYPIGSLIVCENGQQFKNMKMGGFLNRVWSETSPTMFEVVGEPKVSEKRILEIYIQHKKTSGIRDMLEKYLSLELKDLYKFDFKSSTVNEELKSLTN